MITATDVAEHLIDKLAEHYPKPTKWEADAQLIAIGAPSWATTADLEVVALAIITTRTARTFPDLPTLRKAVARIQRAARQTSTGKSQAEVWQEQFGEDFVDGPRPLIWVRNNDPDYLELARRWGREKRQNPPVPIRSKYFTGHGWAFPADWVPWKSVKPIPVDDETDKRTKLLDVAERRAIALLRGTPVCERALAENWAVGLLDHVTCNGCLPTTREEHQIIAKVRANDVKARDFPDAPPDPRTPPGWVSIGTAANGVVGAAIRRLRAEMHNRANRLLAP
jgi:hypothetical protein